MTGNPDTNKQQQQIFIEASDPLSAEMAALVSALDRELNERCGPARNHGSPVSRLAQPDVSMFVARRSGDPLGCAALQIGADGTAEVKRMYVVPGGRALGAGRLLLSRIEFEARRAGVKILRLETAQPLNEAIRLYERSGFRACPAFGPYIAEPINLYFEKALE